MLQLAFIFYGKLKCAIVSLCVRTPVCIICQWAALHWISVCAHTVSLSHVSEWHLCVFTCIYLSCKWVAHLCVHTHCIFYVSVSSISVCTHPCLYHVKWGGIVYHLCVGTLYLYHVSEWHSSCISMCTLYLYHQQVSGTPLYLCVHTVSVIIWPVSGTPLYLCVAHCISISWPVGNSVVSLCAHGIFIMSVSGTPLYLCASVSLSSVGGAWRLSLRWLWMVLQWTLSCLSVWELELSVHWACLALKRETTSILLDDNDRVRTGLQRVPLATW